MDKKLVGLIVVFFLVFGLVTSLMVFQEPLTRFSKAKEDFIPSGTKSAIFAWPLMLTADVKNESTITIFVRNEKGVTIAKRKVSLNTTLGNLKQKDVISDKSGKAEFKLTSQTEGTAEIRAVIDDSIPIIQTVSIKFNQP